jgi:hypothetical protein
MADGITTSPGFHGAMRCTFQPASAIAFACFQIRASKSGCIDVTIVIVFVDLVDIFTLIE